MIVEVIKPPEALVRPLEPVRARRDAKVLSSYEEAFYSVSEAYIATMERIAKHNNNINAYRLYLETLDGGGGE